MQNVPINFVNHFNDRNQKLCSSVENCFIDECLQERFFSSHMEKLYIIYSFQMINASRYQVIVTQIVYFPSDQRLTPVSIFHVSTYEELRALTRVCFQMTSPCHIQNRSECDINLTVVESQKVFNVTRCFDKTPSN